jgi:uncharacterized protein YdeI (YjbR/CyaY-like superfamily)
MSKSGFDGLSRPIEEMPPFVERALTERDLLAAYRRRPAYQQNDYLAWIRRAVKPETKQRRLEQVLAELASGDRYMNMPWKPR